MCVGGLISADASASAIRFIRMSVHIQSYFLAESWRQIIIIIIMIINIISMQSNKLAKHIFLAFRTDGKHSDI